LAVALAAFSLGLPLFAIGGKEAPAAPITVRAGALKGPSGIGMIYLFETPPTLPGSSTLAMEAIPSADAMAARLLSGEIDAAVLPVNMAAKLYNAGLPYRMVAVVGNGMVKVVTTDPAVTAIGDLKGRRVYVAGQGATPEFLMRTVLPGAGIDPGKDIDMVFNMPYPEIAASVVAGRVDIAVLPEPFATLALKGNPAARVRSGLVDERPELVAALLKAYEASIRDVLADPVAAGALVEKHDMGLKAPIAAAAIPACAFTFIPALEARPAVEALLSVFLASSPASIGSRLPDAAWYANVPR